MSSSSPPASRHLAAVWFADVVGYSTLAAQDEATALHLVRQFQEHCRRVLRDHGGRLVKFTGDGTIAEFTSTEAAARAALDLQSSFGATTGHRLRVGIHVGDLVLTADGDVYGDGVNRAARVQQATRPGEVFLSEDAYRQLRPNRGFRFESRGRQVLKGMREPDQLYALALAPEGAPHLGPAARSAPHRRPRAVLAAVGGLFGLGVGAYVLLAPSVPARFLRGPERASPSIASLAVLPLQNLLGDRGQDYLADGITEGLTAELGRTPGLRVISRTSAMRYKASPKRLPEITRELGVDAAVEGSVQQAGEQLRVTVQLVHGATDRHLWAESYAAATSDLPRLQREIAHAIIGHIDSRLPPAERARHQARGDPDGRAPHPRAYEAYLKGRYHFDPAEREALITAMRYYEAAIALDSSFAPAYAALAEACLQPTIQFHFPSLGLCKAAAHRAIELDDGLAEAHAALGRVRAREWDWRGAEESLEQALRLNPNSVSARQWYSELLREMMRKEEALRQIRAAEALDPMNLFVKTMVGFTLYDQRRYDEALVQWDEVLEMDPGYGQAIFNQGLAYAQKGMPREARAAAGRAAPHLGADAPLLQFLRAVGHVRAGEGAQARQILSELETQPSALVIVATLHLVLGDQEAALDWLERGYERRDPWLPTATSQPWFDPLRDHPRFRELRANMGLPVR